jgi:hypothetical protein
MHLFAAVKSAYNKKSLAPASIVAGFLLKDVGKMKFSLNLFCLFAGDLQADAVSISSRRSAVSSSREDSQSVASSETTSVRGGGGASSITSGASQLTLEDNWRPQSSLPSYSQVC